MTISLIEKSPRWKYLIALGAIAATVLVAFAAAMQLSFVGDDWIFLDIVGRLNLHDYLVKYFDPSAQTAWYRPVQGIQYLIGYKFFGSDPFGYHLENVLLHLANCWLLFGLALHLTRQARIAFVAALLYATFPIAVEGIFKAGVIDPLLTVFSLMSIWFWLRYLERGTRRDYWLAFVNFILALYCKESSIMLPIILCLIDRLAPRVTKPTTWGELLRRYFWFAAAFIPYAVIEYIVTQRSIFVSHEGYAPGIGILANLVGYFSGLAFPWVYAPPLSGLLLVLALAVLAYFVIAKKKSALICVAAVAVLPVLPIAPFPQVSPRFLYFSLTASAFLFALMFDWAWRCLPRARTIRALTFGVVALAVAFGSMGIADATTAFAEFARVNRVSFRNVRQWHPTLPADTLLYFFYPPLPGPNLSGMFFSYYGSSVTSISTDSDVPANWRTHALAYVYCYDAQGSQIEQRVDQTIAVRATPAPPVIFDNAIRLEGFELASGSVVRGQSLLMLLYWRGTRLIATDYTVGVHLVDAAGHIVAGYDKEPRRGTRPSSSWTPGELIVDAIQLPIPAETPPGDYRLEVELYDAASQQRLTLVDSSGATANKILIESVRVGE